MKRFIEKVDVPIAMLLLSCQVAISQTTTTETTVIQEPAYVTPTRLAPLPVDKSPGQVVDVQIQLNPKPIYKKRLAAILEQIENGETKGWITSDVAADLKRQRNEIVTLAESIHDQMKADRQTVDQVESRLTVLNAAVYDAFNKPATSKAVTSDADKTDKQAESPNN